MQTRREALDSIKVESIERRVFDCIAEEPRTDEEIADVLDLKLTTAQARRVALFHAGLIRPTGRTRSLASGRDGIVWEAVPEGEPVHAIDEVRLSTNDKREAFRELRALVLYRYPAGGEPEALRHLARWLAFKVQTDTAREG